MGIINLEDIQVGMVLAGDIRERSGRVLLASGSEITENHLRVFKMWGITEADIKDVEKEEIAA
ncbi:MAG: HDOD domain-containing protein, partial [Syntrophales bacterium]